MSYWSGKTVRRLGVLLGVLSAFAYGVAVGVYRLPPFTLIQAAQDALTNPDAVGEAEPYRGEQEILRFGFTDALVVSDEQIWPPCERLACLAERIDAYVVPLSSLNTAYSTLTLRHERDEDRAEERMEVAYDLEGKTYHTYSYVVRRDGAAATSCAAFVIPGSGHNQSSAMVRGDAATYQGTLVPVLAKYCDTYVYVKPNEDFLAIHNGVHKLNYDFILAALLNRGSSYAAHYLINCIATVKYLQRRYPNVLVLGLSQGGEAALLTALQAEPTAAFVASGYSVLAEDVVWKDFHQIIIPGLEAMYSNEHIYALIERAKTRYVFTWGRGETAHYKMEAEEALTCTFFKHLSNVSCVIHDAGHVFPLASVEAFMQAHAATEARQ